MSQRAPAGESHRKNNAVEFSEIQTTGPRAVDSEGDTTSEESDDPRRGGESKSEEEDNEEESDDPSDNSEPSEHARLNKVKEEEIASGIQQLTLRDRILVDTTPPYHQSEPMASIQAGPSAWAGTDSITLKAAPILWRKLKGKNISSTGRQ